MTDTRDTRIQTQGDAGYASFGRAPAQSKIQNPKSKIEQDLAEMPADLKQEVEEVSKSRRDFMKITGMAAMGAVIAGCTAEERGVSPLIDKPEGVVPGVHYHYAGTCSGCSANCGTLVKVRDGRPIKIEGNNASPINSTADDVKSNGALCAVGQAQLWTLYNPDRLKSPMKGGEATDWKTLDAAVKKAVGGDGVVLLTGTVNGPGARDVIRRFVAKTGAKHVAYDSVSAHAIAKAHGKTHGVARVPHYRFDKADGVVVSFDADFLGTWISPVEHARDWGKHRDLKYGKKKMSRLLSFEARMSLTGANADQRWRIKDSERGAVLVDLANRLGGEFGSAGEHSVPAEEMAAVAKELQDNARRSLVVCGSRDLDQQLVVNWINHKLGAYGNTIDSNRFSNQKLGDDDALAQLLKDMEGGKVKTLVAWDVNPVYDLPDGEKFKAALEKVGTKVAINRHADETASLCDWIAAEDDPLEAWNDFEPVSGVYQLNQPMLQRLWDTRNPMMSLLKWAGESDGDKSSYRIALKKFWETNVIGVGQGWDQAVESGVITRSGAEGDSYNYVGGDKPGDAGKLASGEGLEIVTYESYNLRDGRHATNGWLHEMGDPLSRVTWTNLALMSPATMEARGIGEGDVIEITSSVDGREAVCKLPAGRQPGLPDDVVAISLGYGRTKAGKISHGMGIEKEAVDKELLGEEIYKIGGNAFPLRSNKPVFGNISQTGETIDRLARISKHDSQEGRPILKETSLEQWLKNPAAGNQEDLPALDLTVWPKWEYKGHKWGMVVDLNKCTGCNACLVACNVENNIPVVGKEEVWRRREMHWIRIDRYYEDNDGSMYDGDLTKDPNPEVAFQPMMCQHCENAPCETVCPVIATSHSEEGLNVQTYNRCIGTRYCANNCPYKVRRFNWFMYEWRNLTMNLVLNPDITVRSQGVMEKCSMCAQRVYAGKREAALNKEELKDGNILPACAQTCPTDAITFGDQNNEKSRVAKFGKDPRNYQVLAEINTRPAVTYLTKVRNRPTKHDHEKVRPGKGSGHEGHDH